MGIYEIDSQTKLVTAGPYEGEFAGPCDGASGTAPMHEATLSRDEARRMREAARLGITQLHLNSNSRVAGRYCLPSRDQAALASLLRSFDCGLLDEAGTPLLSQYRCDIVRSAIAQYAPPQEESGNLLLAGIIGALALLDAAAAALTFRSWRRGGDEGNAGLLRVADWDDGEATGAGEGPREERPSDVPPRAWRASPGVSERLKEVVLWLKRSSRMDFVSPIDVAYADYIDRIAAGWSVEEASRPPPTSRSQLSFVETMFTSLDLHQRRQIEGDIARAWAEVRGTPRGEPFRNSSLPIKCGGTTVPVAFVAEYLAQAGTNAPQDVETTLGPALYGLDVDAFEGERLRQRGVADAFYTNSGGLIVTADRVLEAITKGNYLDTWLTNLNLTQDQLFTLVEQYLVEWANMSSEERADRNRTFNSIDIPVPDVPNVRAEWILSRFANDESSGVHLVQIQHLQIQTGQPAATAQALPGSPVPQVSTAEPPSVSARATEDPLKDLLVTVDVGAVASPLAECAAPEAAAPLPAQRAAPASGLGTIYPLGLEATARSLYQQMRDHDDAAVQAAITDLSQQDAIDLIERALREWEVLGLEKRKSVEDAAKSAGQLDSLADFDVGGTGEPIMYRGWLANAIARNSNVFPLRPPTFAAAPSAPEGPSSSEAVRLRMLRATELTMMAVPPGSPRRGEREQRASVPSLKSVK